MQLKEHYLAFSLVSSGASPCDPLACTLAGTLSS
jgi:hypothetical protein